MIESEGTITKIESIDGKIRLIIDLPNVSNGLGYIGFKDPDKEKKTAEEDAILKARIKSQRFCIGNVVLTQNIDTIGD